MSEENATVVIVSDLRWFRLAFKGFLRTFYSEANIREIEASEVDAEKFNQTRMLVVDTQCFDASTLHKLPEQITRNNSTIDITLVAVIKNVDDMLTETLMMARFNGVIVKSQPPANITESLQLLAEGKNCRPAPTVQMKPVEIPEQLKHQLSGEEQAVMTRLMAGTSIAAIAKEFEISEKDCVSHARRITGMLRNSASAQASISNPGSDDDEGLDSKTIH